MRGGRGKEADDGVHFLPGDEAGGFTIEIEAGHRAQGPAEMRNT